jgi:quercetin dioxygenase-like cupin family protein
MTNLNELYAIAPQAIWDGITSRAVHGEKLTLAIVEVEPDAHVPEHDHENEQIGIVVRGAVRFRVGDETRDLGPGGTWRIPGGVPHEVHGGPEGAILIEAFAPHRADWDRFEPEAPSAPRWP